MAIAFDQQNRTADDDDCVGLLSFDFSTCHLLDCLQDVGVRVSILEEFEMCSGTSVRVVEKCGKGRTLRSERGFSDPNFKRLHEHKSMHR